MPRTLPSVTDRDTTGSAKPTSFLVEETTTMERDRREQEQKGLRALLHVRVHAKEHSEFSSQTESLEQGYQEESALEQHPLLDGQQFDGIDNNPEDPRLTPEGREKVRRKKAEQDLAKQLRLEARLENTMQNRYTPKFNPKPSPG